VRQKVKSFDLALRPIVTIDGEEEAGENIKPDRELASSLRF